MLVAGTKGLIIFALFTLVLVDAQTDGSEVTFAGSALYVWRKEIVLKAAKWESVFNYTEIEYYRGGKVTTIQRQGKDVAPTTLRQGHDTLNMRNFFAIIECDSFEKTTPGVPVVFDEAYNKCAGPCVKLSGSLEVLLAKVKAADQSSNGEMVDADQLYRETWGPADCPKVEPWIIAVSVAAGILFLCMIAGVIFFCVRRKSQREKQQGVDVSAEMGPTPKYDPAHHDLDEGYAQNYEHATVASPPQHSPDIPDQSRSEYYAGSSPRYEDEAGRDYRRDYSYPPDYGRHHPGRGRDEYARPEEDWDYHRPRPNYGQDIPYRQSPPWHAMPLPAPAPYHDYEDKYGTGINYVANQHRQSPHRGRPYYDRRGPPPPRRGGGRGGGGRGRHGSAGYGADRMAIQAQTGYYDPYGSQNMQEVEF